MGQMIGELLTLSQEGRDVTDLKPVALERVVRRARETVDADRDVVVTDETDSGPPPSA